MALNVSTIIFKLYIMDKFNEYHHFIKNLCQNFPLTAVSLLARLILLFKYHIEPINHYHSTKCNVTGSAKSHVLCSNALLLLLLL